MHTDSPATRLGLPPCGLKPFRCRLPVIIFRRHRWYPRLFLAQTDSGPDGGCLIFLAVLLSCLLGFREVVVHIPTVNRMVQPLRQGRLVVSAALVAEFQFVLSLLIAVSVMSRIERRSLVDYGLPARDAFGRYFWQGVVWGLLAVTCVIMLIFAAGGFSFGGLALHGCYIEMANPMPQGTLGNHWSPGKAVFQACGRVIYSNPNMGSGVEFQGVEAPCQAILEEWLLEAKNIDQIG